MMPEPVFSLLEMCPLTGDTTEIFCHCMLIMSTGIFFEDLMFLVRCSKTYYSYLKSSVETKYNKEKEKEIENREGGVAMPTFLSHHGNPFDMN